MRQQYHFRKVGEDVFIWDVVKLNKLAESLDSQEISLTSIAEIDQAYWFTQGGAEPTCRNVTEHAKLIMEADLAFPILLCHKGKVMDGMHRICKAVMLGHKTIKAKKLPHAIAPDFINVDASELTY